MLPDCPDCHGEGVIETSPAGAGHDDDLAEYAWCRCRFPQHCEACREASGVCVTCNRCMPTHCQCDPCQHGRRRDEECVTCGRESFADSKGL